MIELQSVTRVYGHKTAVRGLDLALRPGELFAFLGPNGAGKTTTTKMLVGLLQPTSGEVRIGGIDLARQPREASRLVGYVPDQPQLYDKLSGREFLLFVAQVYGMSGAAAHTAIERQIQTFELADFVDFLTESYSHGMKQRLAFAAALVHDPKVLILDEPMVGLDPRSMRLVKDLLRREANRGVTVFMSTHTLPLAEETADRLGIIDEGKLVFLGTMAELRQRMSQETGSLENLYLRLTSPDEAGGPIHTPPAGAAVQEAT